MEPTRPDRILQEWSAVADSVRRPAMPPRRVGIRNVGPGAGVAGAGALLTLTAVLVAAVLIGRSGANGVVGVGASGSPGSPVPTATGAAIVAPSDVPSPTAAPTPTAMPTPPATGAPTAAPTPGPCDPSNLVARITEWGGAAGNRIASVEMTNAGTPACTLRAIDRPQLVDGTGAVLIDGSAPTRKTLLTVAPGDVLTTLVSASNYCGPDPTPPVSLAFVMAGGGRIVATPFSPTDATVPPCNGAGSGASIQMQPWTH